MIKIKTINELKNMLNKLRIQDEKLHNNNSSTYAKGFLAGQITLLNYFISEGENYDKNNI